MQEEVASNRSLDQCEEDRKVLVAQEYKTVAKDVVNNGKSQLAENVTFIHAQQSPCTTETQNRPAFFYDSV